MRRLMLTPLWCPFGQLLFGLWLFGWLPFKPPRWLTEGVAVDPAVAYPGLARVVFLFLLVVISAGLFIWIDTARLRRRFPLFDLPAMTRCVLASRRGATMFLVSLLLFGQLSWLIFRGVPPDSYFVRIAFVMACGVLMIFLLPPTAIVLASSSPASGKLLENTARQLFPFRVLSLLDGKRLGPTIFAGKTDNLRTIMGRSWRAAVHRLIEITPLVIVDARLATPPVCEEVRHMLDARRVVKAIFIVNDDGSAPALREAGADARKAQLVCYPAYDVPRAIDRFLSTGAAAADAGEGNPDINRLIRALGSSDERVYELAASSLIEIGSPAVEPLARILSDRRRPSNLRYRAAVVLGRMTCDLDPACLLTALEDPDRNVQQGAAWALGKRRIRQAVPGLVSLLHNPDSSWHTKAFAVEALGDIGGSEARVGLSAYSTSLDEIREALGRGESQTPELQLLRDYLSRRMVAFGGDTFDMSEMVGMMDMALSQFKNEVRAAIRRAQE